ncbi:MULTISPECIES: cytochrome C oxidase subunit I [unclassified Paraburkholderia]|uniref:SCO family protein n=1 Tax=unclassified Paraburkholderia TaxID=2615204 RepID=UPI00160950EB|nr:MULTISPECIES: cytochrome C oxidase subunit I [unclassified Paraburkholderia]MBB5441675.1 cytochrome oxidase Cu insertion factor (SCO1/SenC/PrrC family) [Paraburkholderia sp. WSM4177]MBB5482071.1 cytochrome oxidase Cu insertion factor (SCO1/SenC/PrrC family) [Paraburkholderia sp. WSM4180]
MSTQTPRSPEAGKPSGKPAAAKAISGQPNGPGSWRRGRWVLLLLAVICAAPIAISYFMYYVVKPTGGSTNYGALIEPQRPIPDSLMVTGADGKPLKLASLHGRWLMISADNSACDKACVTKLYFMRQIRAAQGPERERVMEVWLRTDADKVADVIQTAYPNTDMLIADPAQVAAWLPADTATRITDHIYLVDPSGNLMMRFPKDANPSKIKGDLTKLLKWSTIG